MSFFSLQLVICTHFVNHFTPRKKKVGCVEVRESSLVLVGVEQVVEELVSGLGWSVYWSVYWTLVQLFNASHLILRCVRQLLCT